MKIHRIELNEEEAKATLNALDTIMEFETNDPDWTMLEGELDIKAIKRVAFLGSARAKVADAKIEEYPKN